MAYKETKSVVKKDIFSRYPMAFTQLLFPLAFLLLSIGANVATAHLEPSKVLDSSHCKVLVFDKVFGQKILGVMSELLMRHAPWDFIYPEHYEGMKSNENGDLHWIAAFSPESFLKSRIWKILKKKLSGVFRGHNYLPYEANGVLINRGDFPTVQKGKNSDDMFIRIMLTEDFKKNDYSELVFYDENEEIFGSVYQKFGRVIVWNDTTDFIFKPPSMNHEPGEYSIFIKATTDKEKYNQSVKRHKEKAEERSRISEEPFPLTNVTDDSIYKINLTKHLTRKFYDRQNRIVAVFDDVVPRNVLYALREYFFKYDSSYVYNPHDPDQEELHDNVNWVAQDQAERLTPSQVWQYVKHVATYLSGESNWYPYDVSMNIIQHNHHPRIHTDCSEWEHEYTFLMYLSTDWDPQKYGETIFLEETDKKKNKKKRVKVGDEKYETLGAVVPKFGRIAMFRNIIDHSARPPSPDFLAARYTFAVKIGRNPQIATGKKLRELLGDFAEQDKGAIKLMNDLTKRKYDEGDEKLDFLDAKYMEYKKKKSNIDKERKNHFYDLLYMK